MATGFSTMPCVYTCCSVGIYVRHFNVGSVSLLGLGPVVNLATRWKHLMVKSPMCHCVYRISRPSEYQNLHGCGGIFKGVCADLKGLILQPVPLLSKFHWPQQNLYWPLALGLRGCHTLIFLLSLRT